MNSSDISAIRNNERFVATTKNLDATVALAVALHHVITFSNPANSGVEVFIEKILFFGNGTAMIPTSASIVINPTLVTANMATPNNLMVGAALSDTTTLIGYNFGTAGLVGTPQPFELPQANGVNILNSEFGLKPGSAFGIDLTKSAAIAANTSGYFMIYYSKLPV